jgi:hypothetical protein
MILWQKKNKKLDAGKRDAGKRGREREKRRKRGRGREFRI